MSIDLNDPILILREWKCQIDRGDFAVWAAPALLKLYIEVSLHLKIMCTKQGLGFRTNTTSVCKM